MAYADLRLFPDINGDNKILDPTVFSGENIISKDTYLLIQFTANNVCTTCDFSDMCETNGARGIYVHCSHPQSRFGDHIHNALQGCEKHTNKSST